jgi:hypothetical protein
MRLPRWTSAAFVALAMVGCKPQEPAAAPAAAPPGPARGTAEWKIQNAMSAAPTNIATGAVIMDWATTDTGKMTQLRAGTNGWTCLPDIPQTPGNDPTCADQTMMNFFGAWMGHQPPRVTTTGYAYMLQGGSDASNTDPYKMSPDTGAQWVKTGPHVMMVVPNAQAAFASMPTDPTKPGPFIMWKGTPYAHVMVPVGEPRTN